MFEPEVFRKQMYCTEVPVILLGLFGARGIVPLAPVVPPVIIARSDAPQQNHGIQLQPEAYGNLGLQGGIFQSARISASL